MTRRHLEVSHLIGLSLDEIERALIIETLKSVGWNQFDASDILGITDRTIRNKIRRYRRDGFVIPGARPAR